MCATAGPDGANGQARSPDSGTNGAARSRIRTSLSRPAGGTAGACCPAASRALQTAQQIAQGLAGSKVSLAAESTDSVRA